MKQTISIHNGLISDIFFSKQNCLIIDGQKLQFPDDIFFHAGLTDAHCHLFGLGFMQSQVQLSECKSHEECYVKVLQAAQNLNETEWIIGFGWNEENWDVKKLPSKKLISNVPNPVILYRVDTHSAWVNQKAIDIANLKNGTIVNGGEIMLDKFDKDFYEPSGILIDNAINLVEKFIPELTKAKKKIFIQNAINACLESGLTELHDMNVSYDILNIMKELDDDNKFFIRNNIFLEMPTSNQEDDLNIKFNKPQHFGKNIFVAGVKFFADGALGSRGAALLQNYRDAETQGLELLTSQRIIELCHKPLTQGFAVAIHAIGDKANRNVLQAYGVLRNNFCDAVLRVEHSQILHKNDIELFPRYDIIPSVQPYHFVSDKEMAMVRLGANRLGGAYLWKSFVDCGLQIIGGSDFPIESHDPLTGIRAYCGANTTDWHINQNLNLEQALASYSKWTYRGLPSSAITTKRGELAPGYQADIVVFSHNPLHEECRVLLTLIGGKIMYSAL